MKRIFAIVFSILFVLSCLFPSLIIFAEEKPENALKYDDKARDILVALSVVSETQVSEGTESQIVTRGELADILTRLSLYPEGGSSELVEYDDVDETHKYCTGILGANTLGLMKGYGDNTFRPDKGVTYSELSKVLIRLLGYEMVIQNDNYDPYATAAALKLFVNLKGTRDKDTVVDKASMVTIIFNAIHTDMMEPSSYGSNQTYEVAKGHSILTEYFGVYWNKGIITKNEVTAISSPSVSPALEGCVEINGYDYMVGTTNAADLLGYRVEYYYKINVNGVSDRQLLYVSEKGLNEVLTISSKSLIEPGNDIRIVKYRDESDHIGTQTIQSTVFFLYNGVPASLTKENITVDTGEIIFINNGSGTKWSVVRVEAYETVVVESMDASRGVIYSKYPNTTSLSGTEGGDPNFTYDPDELNRRVFFYDSYGDLYDPKAITEWDVLLIKRDRSNRRTNIQRLVIEKEGTVTAKSGEDIIFVDDYEYEVAPWLINRNPSVMPEMGKSYLFYLDSAGRIVAVRALNENEYSFAYFIDGEVNRNSRTYTIQICEDTGNVVLRDLASKVKIDGVSKNTPKEQQAAIESVATSVKTRLIQIKYNQDGLIKEIKTVAGGEFLHEDYTGIYYSSTSTIGGKVAIDSSVVHFYIPTNGDIEKYYSRKGTSELTNDRGYNSSSGDYAYRMADKSKVVVFVHLWHLYDFSAGYFNALGSSHKTYMVDSMRYSLDENEDAYITEILACTNGTMTTLRVRDEIVLNCISPVKDYYSSNNLSEQIFTNESALPNFKLEKGDIIKVKTDYEGYVTRIEVIYDYDKDRMFVKNPSTPYNNNKGGFTDSYRILMGYVYEREDEFFKLACTAGGPSTVPEAIENISQVEVMKEKANIITVYDSYTGEIYKGTMADVFTYKLSGENATRTIVEVSKGSPIRMFVFR